MVGNGISAINSSVGSLGLVADINEPLIYQTFMINLDKYSMEHVGQVLLFKTQIAAFRAKLIVDERCLANQLGGSYSVIIRCHKTPGWCKPKNLPMVSKIVK